MKVLKYVLLPKRLLVLVASVTLASGLVPFAHGEKAFPGISKGEYHVDRWGYPIFMDGYSFSIVDDSLVDVFAPYEGVPISVDITKLEQQANPGVYKLIEIGEIERLEVEGALDCVLRIKRFARAKTGHDVVCILSVQNPTGQAVPLRGCVLGVGVFVFKRVGSEYVRIVPGKPYVRDSWSGDSWSRVPHETSDYWRYKHFQVQRVTSEEAHGDGLTFAEYKHRDCGIKPGGSFEIEVVLDGFRGGEYEAYLYGAMVSQTSWIPIDVPTRWGETDLGVKVKSAFPKVLLGAVPVVAVLGAFVGWRRLRRGRVADG